MKTIICGSGIVDYATAARVIEMAPWPIPSPDVLTAHGVDLDHSIIRVAIPPGNRYIDTWSSSPCRELTTRAEDRHTSSHDLDRRSWSTIIDHGPWSSVPVSGTGLGCGRSPNLDPVRLSDANLFRIVGRFPLRSFRIMFSNIVTE
jgi:hypothetical protein